MGDKSQNKALTVAKKYALRQTFCIATGDDPENESSEGMRKSAGTTSKKIEPGMANHIPNERSWIIPGKWAWMQLALGKALGLAGFKDVELTRWDELIKAVDDYVEPV